MLLRLVRRPCRCRQVRRHRDNGRDADAASYEQQGPPHVCIRQVEAAADLDLHFMADHSLRMGGTCHLELNEGSLQLQS